MKIVFWGTPEIAVPSLEFFIKHPEIEVLGLITQPDRPSGRGHKRLPPPTKVLAETHNIPVFQPLKVRTDAELIEKLKELKPDAFITVAFGQILSKEILDIPRLGTINLHASLLPKYRGANPIQRAVVNGEKTSGVTTMLSDVGVDTGPMLLKEEITITENMTSVELANIIAQIGPALLEKSIFGLDKNEIKSIPQNDEEATLAPKFKKEDGLINWNNSSINIHNKIRGLTPWPSTYTYFRGNMVKIIETAISSTNNKENINTSAVGEIMGIIDNEIAIKTGDGIILVKKLQPAGKGVIDAKNWFNGARIQKGEIFSDQQ